jgi:hypothetical protein
MDNIYRINRNVIVKTLYKANSANVTEIFSDCEVIVEAFDLSEMKKL